MKTWLIRIAVALLVLLTALLVTIYALFGGGRPYPDLSGAPRLPRGAIEAAVVSPRPMGNVAVSASGRVFYTIHPESNPSYPKLYEWVAGKPVPWPRGADQSKLFATPLGVRIDGRNRLWIIDPASHGTGQPRLIAFDVDSGREVHRFDFPGSVAPLGSFLQDMSVSPDGRWVYIADVGFWAKRPAIVVYDTQTRTAHRVLNRDASVYPQNILIRNPIRPMRFFGGLLEMKTGVDGIAASRDGAWVYYAAMNHDTLYRVPAAALQNSRLDDAAVRRQVQAVGRKPLNDGITTDDAGNVFLTDVEHSAVLEMTPQGKLRTVVKDPRIRWADGLSWGPDGWLYLADSAIPHIVLQSAAHHAANAPYHVWRFKPGTSAPAGE
jgi:DNA-binding beta-propeller fold protein YncE